MQSIRGWLAVAACLALLGPARADQNDPRLDPLFETLRGSEFAQQIRVAEQLIWSIWLESGREDADLLMKRGIRQMSSGRLRKSIETFGRIIELLPGFAEGWNKRATAYYLAGELEASLADVERTLALEPRHFGALSGSGLIYLALGDDEGALEAFEATLEVHPHAPGARHHVGRLRAKLGIRTT